MIDLTNETDRQQRIRKGRDFDTMPPEERLAHYEAGQAKQKAPAPEAKPLTGPQIDYLGNRRAEDLSDPVDRANFEALGGPIFQQKPEAPVSQEAALDAPVDWRSAKLDTTRMQRELGPTERLAIAHSFEYVQRVGPANAREIDRLQAESWLVRAA